jgi:hypothetical protein
MPFVIGNRGELVNLDHVLLIKPIPTAAHPHSVVSLVMAGDEPNIVAPAAVTETIVQLIPVSGQWDVLALFEDDDYALEAIIEPVIAWALLLDATMIPVTGDSIDGSTRSGPYGMRSRDNPTVYVPYDASYPSAADWLAHETLARSQARERQAARDAAKPAAG